MNIHELLRKKIPNISYKNIQNKEGVFYGRKYFKTATRYMDSMLANEETALFEPETFTLKKDDRNKLIKILEERLKEYYETYQEIQKREETFMDKSGTIDSYNSYQNLKEQINFVKESFKSNKYSYYEIWLLFFEDDVWQDSKGEYLSKITFREYDTFIIE